MCDCEFPDSWIKSRQHYSLDRSSYYRWRNMHERCYQTHNKDYANYGERGIRVCKQWMMSFADYHAFVGKKVKGMTLDRPNNDGNYCPHNIKWSTSKEQNNNRRPLVKKSSLPIGVYWHKANGYYVAQIKIDGKCKHLGHSDSVEGAMELYRAGSIELRGFSPY